MTPAVPAEFARHAWDFRDAAVAAENMLGERDEYLLGASLPVACLFGVSVELALRSYILAMNPSSMHAADPHDSCDLQLLYDEASELGLVRLVRIDGYDLQLLHWLGQLRWMQPSRYAGTSGNEIPPFDPMRKLCEKLLEVACATAGYERVIYK